MGDEVVSPLSWEVIHSPDRWGRDGPASAEVNVPGKSDSSAADGAVGTASACVSGTASALDLVLVNANFGFVDLGRLFAIRVSSSRIC